MSADVAPVSMNLVTLKLPLIDDGKVLVRVPARIIVAVACAALAAITVAVLEPMLTRPYIFPAFVGIILSAVVAGGRYAILTTALFGVAYAYFFLEPRGSISVAHPQQLAALTGYMVTGCIVAAISAMLRRAYRAVQAQHRVLTELIAQREDLLHALTHDIRAPLSAMSLNADVLARGSPDPENVRRRATLIQNSLRAVDAMLGDLVKVAALESGKVILERTSVSLTPLLDQLRADMAGALPMERVAVALPAEVPPVDADARRLQRVLVNLISNALKYSSGPVVVTAARRGAEVLVSICDEGPGIAAEDLPYVFEKFYRAAGVRKTKEGLGLGLYISRLVVEAHGGRIWVDSAPGRGSTFTVALPIARGSAARTPAAGTRALETFRDGTAQR